MCIFFVQEFIKQTVKIRVCNDASHVSLTKRSANGRQLIMSQFASFFAFLIDVTY